MQYPRRARHWRARTTQKLYQHDVECSDHVATLLQRNFSAERIQRHPILLSTIADSGDWHSFIPKIISTQVVGISFSFPNSVPISVLLGASQLFFFLFLSILPIIQSDHVDVQLVGRFCCYTNRGIMSICQY